jgi:hypothetical protein
MATTCTIYRFQYLPSLCPDISNEHRATVSSEGVFEYVGQLGLSIGDVVTLPNGWKKDNNKKSTGHP